VDRWPGPNNHEAYLGAVVFDFGSDLRHFQRFRLIGLCGFGGVLTIRRNTVIAGFVGFFPHQCGKLWNGKNERGATILLLNTVADDTSRQLMAGPRQNFKENNTAGHRRSQAGMAAKNYECVALPGATAAKYYSR